jgi:1,4-alpha-glucan branching enzyme
MTISDPVNLHAGMGPIPHVSGVAFRVWAPNADAVYVTGTFNDWAHESNPMTKEVGGYWYADIPNASIGHEYRYRIVNGDREIMRMDPYARQVTSSVGNALVHDPHFDWGKDDFKLPPINELVIYEMHLGTFHDTKEVKTNCFEESLQKIEYLKQLGVNLIEIMPLAEFGGYTSWGYNPSCVYAVETSYGGPVGFKRFVKALHQAGIGVILDVVYNHFGPTDLDLWQFDGWSENGMGGIYFYNDEAGP